MKVWKKNLVAAAILVTVCAGIYVNWRYTENQAAANLTDTLDTEKVMSDDSLVLSEDMAAISRRGRCGDHLYRLLCRRPAVPAAGEGQRRESFAGSHVLQ